MSQRGVAKLLSVACVGLLFAFLADSVDAQRRGGGGRGGGRSISRAGPAGGGSFRTSGSYGRTRTSQRATTRPSSRPATQPSTRPSTQPSTRPGTQPSTRPSTQPRPGTGETRPGQRPGEGRPGGDRPGDGGNREDWQSHMDQAREDRQKYANNARDEWQDFYEEGGGGYYYYGGYYGHYHVVDYHEDDDDWAVLLAGMAIGSALTSASFSAMQSSTKCTLSEVVVDGVRYFKCGSTWYNRVIDGSNVNYVIVSAPPGY